MCQYFLLHSVMTNFRKRVWGHGFKQIFTDSDDITKHQHRFQWCNKLSAQILITSHVSCQWDSPAQLGAGTIRSSMIRSLILFWLGGGGHIMLSIYESACDVSTDDIVFSGFTSLHERTVILMCISWHSIDSMCSMSNSDTTYMYNQSTAVRLLCAHKKWEKKFCIQHWQDCWQAQIS